MNFPDNKKRKANFKLRDNGGTVKTIGITEGVIDGNIINQKSFSGDKNITGFVDVANPTILPSRTLKNSNSNRSLDNEPKSLTEILNTTNRNSVGKITMVVNRKTCDSCRYLAISRFSKYRLGIEIEIVQYNRND